MEYLPTVHELTGELTGLVLPRSAAIKEKAWCMSTNVFVMNSKGEILCHERSLKKERFPGAWSTHLGGHVGADETFESNALKELMEEAGIQATTASLIPWRTTKLPKACLWVKEFVVYADLELESLIPQEGEVERFAWISPKAILEAQKENPGAWLAGTHDFAVEHHCLRAALNAAHASGTVSIHPDLAKWAD